MCSSARRAAQAADIVVVNHHLLLADLALKDEGFGDLLPGAEAVILDEAHQVPDIAAQFFGQTWSVRQVQILLRDLASELTGRGRARALVAGAAVDRRGAARRLRALSPGGPGRHEWRHLPTAFLDVLAELEAALGGLAADSRVWARAPAPPIARAARAPRRERWATLLEVSEEAGLRWVETARERFDRCSSRPFEIADAIARVRRGAALRVGVHLGDLGDRR